MLKRAAARLPAGITPQLASGTTRGAASPALSARSRNVLAGWQQAPPSPPRASGGAAGGLLGGLVGGDIVRRAAAWGARVMCSSAAAPSAGGAAERKVVVVPKPLPPHPVSRVQEEKKRRERVATTYFDHPIISLSGEPKGTIELASAVFEMPLRKDLLQRVVLWQQARKRHDAIPVKRRGEVSGGGRKPYQQKGTGRARHGSIRSPIWKGGGKAHGRRAKSWAFDIPKKVRRLALRTAISARMREGSLAVVEDLEIEGHKTSLLQGVFDRHGWDSALVISEEIPPNFKLACANIATVDALPALGANVYSILQRRQLVITRSGVEYLHTFLLRH